MGWIRDLQLLNEATLVSGLVQLQLLATDGLDPAGSLSVEIQIDGAWQNLPAPLLAGKHALVFEANEAGAEYYLLPAGLRLQSLRPTQKPDVLFEAVYDF